MTIFDFYSDFLHGFIILFFQCLPETKWEDAFERHNFSYSFLLKLCVSGLELKLYVLVSQHTTYQTTASFFF